MNKIFYKLVAPLILIFLCLTLHAANNLNLGDGYNQFQDRPMDSSCFKNSGIITNSETQPKEISNGGLYTYKKYTSQARLQQKVTTNYNEFFEQLNLNSKLSVKGDIGLASVKLSATYNFVNSIHKKSFSVTTYMLYEIHPYSLQCEWGDSANGADRLNETAKNIWDEGEIKKFEDHYGDGYIDSIKYGERLAVVCTANFNSMEEYEAWSLKLEAEIKVLFAKGTVSTTFGDEFRRSNFTGNLDIKILQLGGNNDELNKVFNLNTTGELNIPCDSAGSLLDKLNEFATKLHNYVQNTPGSNNFPNQINPEDPSTIAVLSYNVRPYANIGGFEDLKPYEQLTQVPTYYKPALKYLGSKYNILNDRLNKLYALDYLKIWAPGYENILKAYDESIEKTRNAIKTIIINPETNNDIANIIAENNNSINEIFSKETGTTPEENKIYLSTLCDTALYMDIKKMHGTLPMVTTYQELPQMDHVWSNYDQDLLFQRGSELTLEQAKEIADNDTRITWFTHGGRYPDVWRFYTGVPSLGGLTEAGQTGSTYIKGISQGDAESDIWSGIVGYDRTPSGREYYADPGAEIQNITYGGPGNYLYDFNFSIPSENLNLNIPFIPCVPGGSLEKILELDTETAGDKLKITLSPLISRSEDATISIWSIAGDYINTSGQKILVRTLGEEHRENPVCNRPLPKNLPAKKGVVLIYNPDDLDLGYLIGNFHDNKIDDIYWSNTLDSPNWTQIEGNISLTNNTIFFNIFTFPTFLNYERLIYFCNLRSLTLLNRN